MFYVNQMLLRTDFFLQDINGILERWIFFQICADSFDTMQDGSCLLCTSDAADDA